jgi:hypothetical protein
MLLRISAFESPAIQGTILALKGVDKELAAQIRKATKSVTVDEWRRAVARNAMSRFEYRVLVATARVATTNTNVSLRSGQLAKKMSGGAPGYLLTPGVEFGKHPGRITSTSSKGKPYERRFGSTFRKRNRKGYVVYPAIAEVIPRIAALWVATTVRTLHEALDEGAR